MQKYLLFPYFLYFSGFYNMVLSYALILSISQLAADDVTN